MNLIPLQSAYANQQRDVDNNNWHVYSEQNKDLATLPGTLSPKLAMSYIHFARPFELEALNIGINFGKQQQLKISQKQMEFYEGRIKFLEEQNEKLSNSLEKAIINKFNNKE